MDSCDKFIGGESWQILVLYRKIWLFSEKNSKSNITWKKKDSSSLQETSPRNFFEASFSSERQSFQVQDCFTPFLQTPFYPRIVHFEKIYPVWRLSTRSKKTWANGWMLFNITYEALWPHCLKNLFKASLC